MSQFLTTLRQIRISEGTSTAYGVYRHLGWQVRRILGLFPVELRISQSRLLVDRPFGVGALVNCMNMYDYNNMRLLQSLLTSSEYTFFDIGANIGTYTLIAAEVSGAPIASFEPHPRSFALLQQNVSLNNRTSVQLFDLALSDRTGTIAFTDLPDLSINRVAEANGAVQVNCRRCDSVCRESHLIPQIVKLDVEGYESAVLQGFGDYISKVLLCFIERGQRAEIASFMDSHGFLGPFYMHYHSGTFDRIPQQREEDTVFFQANFVPNLRDLGYTVNT